ncbi:hypothetical protein [Oligoflexus tunisiensis]|uniref:hypothetical protein n=1 Tax=Oligoflexus tunisiensis TaxID=708132 RepID=UPI00114C8EB1|nr:hypothetical protein [Oligoflexus tunisiensis]
MKRWIALLIAQLTILALLLWPDSYTGLRTLDILQLATGYRAKEICSCLFVLERSEQDCDAWTRDIAMGAAYRVDKSSKSVTGSFQWLGAARPIFPSVAKFQDERRGCLLQR